MPTPAPVPFVQPDTVQVGDTYDVSFPVGATAKLHLPDTCQPIKLVVRGGAGGGVQGTSFFQGNVGGKSAEVR